MWILPKYRLTDLSSRFRHALCLTFSDEALGRRIRGEQIRAVLRLTPLTMLANLCNAPMVVYALWGIVSPYHLTFWAIPVVAAATIPVRSWLQFVRRIDKPGASVHAIHVMTRNAAILGALWGILTLSFFNQVDAAHQLLIACVISGMMFGGAFVLAAVPSAAISYVFVMAIASLVPLFA